jgi:hypothetical protein
VRYLGLGVLELNRRGSGVLSLDRGVFKVCSGWKNVDLSVSWIYSVKSIVLLTFSSWTRAWAADSPAKWPSARRGLG